MSEHAPEESQKNSQLLASLREGVAVVQMVLYKEVRTRVQKTYPQFAPNQQAMLSGSIINEVFGTQNPEPQFVSFRKENWAHIEQELLSLKDNCKEILPFLTDALRVQVLCDSQEGADSASTLLIANRNGYLLDDRDIPLPSTFMTLVRTLGEKNGLVVSPAQVSPEQDNFVIQ